MKISKIFNGAYQDCHDLGQSLSSRLLRNVNGDVLDWQGLDLDSHNR